MNTRSPITGPLPVASAELELLIDGAVRPDAAISHLDSSEMRNIEARRDIRALLQMDVVGLANTSRQYPVGRIEGHGDCPPEAAFADTPQPAAEAVGQQGLQSVAAPDHAQVVACPEALFLAVGTRDV